MSTHPAANVHLPGARISRRFILQGCGALSLSLLALPGPRLRAAPAALTVTVAPPTIVRDGRCMATVSVLVAIAQGTPGVRYEAYGDVLESDEPDGDPDICCALAPQATPSWQQEGLTLLLTGQAMAADLGLVKGVGPASDEAVSPDLVELVARVWLREVDTGAEHGPWQSPPRVAVASTALDWTGRGQFPGSVLAPPRAQAPFTSRQPAGRLLPPQECIS